MKIPKMTPAEIPRKLPIPKPPMRVVPMRINSGEIPGRKGEVGVLGKGLEAVVLSVNGGKVSPMSVVAIVLVVEVSGSPS